ncbi:ABC transporter permease [Amycolatopsis panacis]|nr:ABC transporter permease [Amycolatopsis panacis]
MNHPAMTAATARRILTQLRHDPRTVALLLVVPTALMVLLRYVLDSAVGFSVVAPALLGVFPFTIMFLLTSVSTLRERTGGTLERLMALPLGKLDLLGGYALAFGAVAVVQVVLATGVSVLWLGLSVAGPLWALLLITVLDALLGTALGLLVSAFARTEFQAVQFMPVVVLPQILLCGLFVPRDSMSRLLNALSDVLPLSYAVDALTHVTHFAEVDGTLVRNMLIVAGCAGLALLIGAATLRRRTP